MPFQPEQGTIRWKVHFRSSRETVFAALATEKGRAGYWAQSAPEVCGHITFHILGFKPFTGRILEKSPPSKFAIEYFGTIASFTLHDDGQGGTDLTLVASDVDESIRMEMAAGWVSLLMAMKAAVDHGIDLRNHDPSRRWKSGYLDN